jgi:hypothetical protein
MTLLADGDHMIIVPDVAAVVTDHRGSKSAALARRLRSEAACPSSPLFPAIGRRGPRPRGFLLARVTWAATTPNGIIGTTGHDADRGHELISPGRWLRATASPVSMTAVVWAAWATLRIFRAIGDGWSLRACALRDREHSPDGTAGPRICFDAIARPDSV